MKNLNTVKQRLIGYSKLDGTLSRNKYLYPKQYLLHFNKYCSSSKKEYIKNRLDNQKKVELKRSFLWTTILVVLPVGFVVWKSLKIWNDLKSKEE